MHSIPLYYAGIPVGQALTDDALDTLSPSLVWRVEVPKTIRRACKGRRDILTAMLRDDILALQRCHPYLWICSRIPLRLTRVALRPELLPLINRTAAGSSPTEDEFRQINELRRSVKEVVFLNGNRCDCRLENLREVV